MKILASLVYAVFVIAAGILLWWLVLGCAATQIKDPSPGSQQSGWIAVAEIPLDIWKNLPVEQRAEVVMKVMKIYFQRTECYRANLNVIQKDDKLVFSVRCVEKMVEVKDENVLSLLG